MVSLSSLLKLQWIYVFLGVGYNAVNYIVCMSGGQQLSTTNPITGAFAMMMYGGFLMAAYTGRLMIYRILMFFSVFIYGWGGIVVHFLKFRSDPLLYSSSQAWLLAVSINVLGLALSTMALSGFFKDDMTDMQGK